MNVKKRPDHIEYPVFDQGTKEDVDALMKELTVLSFNAQEIIRNLVLNMNPLIRLRRNMIAALDTWITRAYTTVVPDGLTPTEVAVFKESPKLSARAQVGLHSIFNLHDRQEIIGRITPILNKYRRNHGKES